MRKLTLIIAAIALLVITACQNKPYYYGEPILVTYKVSSTHSKFRVAYKDHGIKDDIKVLFNLSGTWEENVILYKPESAFISASSLDSISDIKVEIYFNNELIKRVESFEVRPQVSLYKSLN